MLLAILFESDDCISAAALACDQQPYGASFWTDIHPARIEFLNESQTAYVEIDDESFRQRLLAYDKQSIDDTVGRDLTCELENYVVNRQLQIRRAA